MGSGASSQPMADRKAVDVPNLKIAIVGNPQSGKTSVINRYIHNQFSPIYIQTYKAAIENVVRKLNVPGHAKVPITLWDIPGHEDLPLHASYFRDLDAVIVVVDISDPDSYESAALWRQSVLCTASYTDMDNEGGREEQETMNENEENNMTKHQRNIADIPFLLLGNKLDLCSQLPNNLEPGVTLVDTVEKSDVEKTSDRSSLLLSEQVDQLEKFAENGFVGCIAVSARNNDLSVHAAIQTFLRIILDKRKLVQRRWLVRNQDASRTQHTCQPRYTQKPQLVHVGIPQIDVEFRQAEEIVYRVNSLQRYQDDSLRKFASECVEVGVIANVQDASMQNCLVALKEKLAESDLKLQLKLDDDFLHLEVKSSKEDATMDKDIRYAVKTFNKEYAAVTKAMLAEFPVAEKKLAQIEARVDKMCMEIQIPLTGIQKQSSSSPDSESQSTSGTKSLGGGQTASGTACLRPGALIERNRAVLRHSSHECHDGLLHTQRSIKQAKAAFVW